MPECTGEKAGDICDINFGEAREEAEPRPESLRCTDFDGLSGTCKHPEVFGCLGEKTGADDHHGHAPDNNALGSFEKVVVEGSILSEHTCKHGVAEAVNGSHC